MINVVLVQPQIPQNTGNIARTCAVTGAKLHLIGPMGFEIQDSKLKRAGLDYWDKLGVQIYDNIDEFFARNAGGAFYFYTTKAVNNYTQVKYEKDCFLIFGREDKGLDEALLHENKERCVRIPMLKTLRSLNLSNSVAVAVYEVLRQDEFETLEQMGKLTQFNW